MGRESTSVGAWRCRCGRLFSSRLPNRGPFPVPLFLVPLLEKLLRTCVGAQGGVMSKRVAVTWKCAARSGVLLDVFTLLACAAISAVGVMYVTHQFKMLAASCNGRAAQDA